MRSNSSASVWLRTIAWLHWLSAEYRRLIRCVRAIWNTFQTGARPSYEGPFYQFKLINEFFNPGPIAHPDIPVIIVTARDAEIDVIVGLDAGASDYVTKPFSSEVLLARMRAQLRSTGRGSIGEVLESGSIRIDRAARTVTVDGRPVELRRREFDLLDLLVVDAGRVVTRERLLADLWDVHWDTTSRSLDMHVLALRRRLGDGVVIGPGTPYREPHAAERAITAARERGVPLVAT